MAKVAKILRSKNVVSVKQREMERQTDVILNDSLTAGEMKNLLKTSEVIEIGYDNGLKLTMKQADLEILMND